MKRNKLFFYGFTITILTLFLVQVTFAQHEDRHKKQEQHKEKIKSHKIAFITDKLDLSPEEAEKFWPVYNEHQNKMETSQKEFRENNKVKAESIPDLSDDEAKDFLNARLNHEQNTLNLRKDLYTQLDQILPPKKILMLLEAEREFKVELMRKLSGPRDGSRGPRPDQRR